MNVQSIENLMCEDEYDEDEDTYVYRPFSLETLRTKFVNTTFVIGVKDDDRSDLDRFIAAFHGHCTVERLPETYNPKYIGDNEDEREEHILQPALITWKD